MWQMICHSVPKDPDRQIESHLSIFLNRSRLIHSLGAGVS